MKIGIDAKWLFNGHPSGQRVIRNLIQALAEDSGGDEVHYFVDGASRGQELPVGDSALRVHRVWARNNQVSNLFVVPRAADALGLDVVVYLNFAPPAAGVRHARVAFVFDAIFESHPEFFTRRERLYFASLRFLTSRADRVCTLSDTERDRLVRFGYADHNRIDIVPLAADAMFVARDHLAPAQVSAVLEQRRLPDRFALYAGRLNRRKNVATLVQAIALVDPSVALVVAGAADGTSDNLRAVAEAAGVSDRVHLLGAVDDAELQVLYATALVFCFVSLDEGFGLPPLEAMAAGTPTIISNIPALVKTYGDAALAVDATSPQKIAAAISLVLGDAGRRETLIAAGLARARAFTWRESAKRLRETAHAAVRGAA